MPAELDATLLQPAPGQIVGGRYQLESELGRGGMGSVWRARNVALEARCAIKFMHPELASKEELRKRFVREARAAGQLSSPHIVTVFDVGDWGGRPFMAMELMEGESLEQRLEREGKLSIESTLEVIVQVARGLEIAHAADLVHRDLKPENIFLLSGPRIAAKILDFGVAKHLEATSGVKTVTGAVIGTPYYMSPEQVRGESNIDRRSDVWALGVVAFECLAGKVPFSATSLPALLGAILHGAIPELGIPGLEPFWSRASQRDPALRFQNATELADGLRDAARAMAASPAPSAVASSALEITRPSAGERYRSLPMRRDARVLLGFGAAIALGLVAWLGASGDLSGEPSPAGTPKPSASAAIVPNAVPATHPKVVETGFELASTPSGATVIVDGSALPHTTPLRVTDLSAGAHKISVERAGYRPFEIPLTVVAGEVLQLPPVALQALAAPSERKATPKATASETSPPPQTKPPTPTNQRVSPSVNKPRPGAARPRTGKYDDLIGF